MLVRFYPSSAAGGMLILAGLYVAEPLVASMFITDLPHLRRRDVAYRPIGYSLGRYDGRVKSIGQCLVAQLAD